MWLQAFPLSSSIVCIIVTMIISKCSNVKMIIAQIKTNKRTHMTKINTGFIFSGKFIIQKSAIVQSQNHLKVQKIKHKGPIFTILFDLKKKKKVCFTSSRLKTQSDRYIVQREVQQWLHASKIVNFLTYNNVVARNFSFLINITCIIIKKWEMTIPNHDE